MSSWEDHQFFENKESSQGETSKGAFMRLLRKRSQAYELVRFSFQRTGCMCSRNKGFSDEQMQGLRSVVERLPICGLD